MTELVAALPAATAENAALSAAHARHKRAEEILEIPVIFAALATIPLTILEANGHGEDAVVQAANWLVWVAFFAEYAGLLLLAPNRAQYARRSLISLGIVLITFPLMPPAFALTRLIRLVRLLRIVTVAWWGLHEFDRIFGRRGMAHMAMFSIFLALGAGGLITILEPDMVKGQYGNGLWWAVTTITTIGSDMSPNTAWGRLLAVPLLIAGLGFISTLAGAISAHFVDEDSDSDFDDVRQRLDRIEQALQQITNLYVAQQIVENATPSALNAAQTAEAGGATSEE